MKKGLVVLIVACLLAGCGAVDGRGDHTPANSISTHNPTAQEVLEHDPNADFFQWHDVIYMNAANIDWVQSLTLIAGEKLGSIGKAYDGSGTFQDGMATKLPVGAEMCMPDQYGSSVIIVKWNGNEARYLAMLEG